MESENLRAALAYARLGWPVFPLHSVEHRSADGAWCTCGKPAGKGAGECAAAGKHPRTQNGLKDASTDLDTIKDWWTSWPAANIAVRTGAARLGAGIWVLDLDAGTGAADVVEAAAVAAGDTAGEWKCTRTARTGGGGLHLLYTYGLELASWLDANGYTLPSRNGIGGKGLDVRSDGGYIVAPPSLHASGRRYAWEDTRIEVSAPEWLLRLVARPVPAQPENRAAPPPVILPGEVGTRKQRYGAKVLQSAVAAITSANDGERHDTIRDQALKVGGYAVDCGMDLSAAEAALIDAGVASGKGSSEVRRAVLWGLDEGAKRPLEVPDRNDYNRGAPMPDHDNAALDVDDVWGRADPPPEVDPLAPWHVAAVLAGMLDPDKPAPVPVAPLPGGYGRGAAVEARPAAELEPEPAAGYDRDGQPLEPGRWPALAGLLRAWYPDTLAVLVGHTGRGKSSLAVQVAERAAREGAPVLYASLEMSAEELVARLLASRGSPGASWSALKRGAYTRSAVVAAGARLVADCPHLYLWAPDSADRNPEALQRMARAVSAVAGNRPPLVILDYVQRLVTADNADRRIAVSDLSGRLRDLSRPGGMAIKEWPGAAVLALSSTGRGNYAAFGSTAEMRMAPDLEGSGKESGELEYDAPILLCMTSDKPGDGEDEPSDGRMALVRVVKNREGSGGAAWMRFDAARGRFVETEAPPLPEKSNAPKGPDPRQLALSLKAADDKHATALLAAKGVRDKALLAAGENEAKIKAAHAKYELACAQAGEVRSLAQTQAHGRQEVRGGSGGNGGSKPGSTREPRED